MKFNFFPLVGINENKRIYKGLKFYTLKFFTIMNLILSITVTAV